MPSTTQPHVDTDPPDESERMRADRAELVDRISRALPENGQADALGGRFILHRESLPTGPLYSVSFPSVCIMAQGAKVIRLGDTTLRYDPFHYLLATAELPITSEIVRASEEEPYLCLVLRLDPELVSEMMIEAGDVASEGRTEPKAIDVSPLGEDLLDAALRLVRLLDAPEEASVVAPLVTREIVYRLLRGAQAVQACRALRQVSLRCRRAASLGRNAPSAPDTMRQPYRTAYSA